RARLVLAELNAWLSRIRLPGGASSGLVRVRFFDGQRLTAADFEAEQTYHVMKHRRHNLRLHGFGIVSGLEVTMAPATGPDDRRVSIAPGCAITPLGEEVVLDTPSSCPLPAVKCSGFVTLTFTERLVAPAP